MFVGATRQLTASRCPGCATCFASCACRALSSSSGDPPPGGAGRGGAGRGAKPKGAAPTESDEPFTASIREADDGRFDDPEEPGQARPSRAKSPARGQPLKLKPGAQATPRRASAGRGKPLDASLMDAILPGVRRAG